MGEIIKQLYNEYYEMLLKCHVDDREKIAYICGAQDALQHIVEHAGIELEQKNLITLAEKVSVMAKLKT